MPAVESTRQGRGAPSESRRRRSCGRICASRIFVAGLGLLFLASTSAWHGVSLATAHAIGLVGMILAVLGAVGRLWCSSYIAGNKNARLVTEGPYSLCRNPLYFFSLIGGLGISLASETLAIPAVFAIGFALLYPGVIRREEATLAQRFPGAFAVYASQVPRFWPSLGAYRDLDRSEHSPRLLARALADNAWFILAAIGVHAVEDLREGLSVSGFLSLY
jgi:protein-S-isoprenylcysteine O-methyltransferase Ste14